MATVLDSSLENALDSEEYENERPCSTDSGKASTSYSLSSSGGRDVDEQDVAGVADMAGAAGAAGAAGVLKHIANTKLLTALTHASSGLSSGVSSGLSSGVSSGLSSGLSTGVSSGRDTNSSPRIGRLLSGRGAGATHICERPPPPAYPGHAPSRDHGASQSHAPLTMTRNIAGQIITPTKDLQSHAKTRMLVVWYFGRLRRIASIIY